MASNGTRKRAQMPQAEAKKMRRRTRNLLRALYSMTLLIMTYLPAYGIWLARLGLALWRMARSLCSLYSLWPAALYGVWLAHCVRSIASIARCALWRMARSLRYLYCIWFL